MNVLERGGVIHSIHEAFGDKFLRAGAMWRRWFCFPKKLIAQSA